jgi:transcription elongation factor GreA
MAKKTQQLEEKIFLTKEGFENIKKEYDEVKNKRRPVVVERLSLARQQGDLSENNEYASAREELAFIDGRIEELDEILGNYCIIENSSSKECVSVGCKVVVDAGKGEMDYCIVGEWEADPVKRKVSHQSPLGQALINKKVGEAVEFNAPAGKIVYKILRIE